MNTKKNEIYMIRAFKVKLKSNIVIGNNKVTDNLVLQVPYIDHRYISFYFFQHLLIL